MRKPEKMKMDLCFFFQHRCATHAERLLSTFDKLRSHEIRQLPKVSQLDFRRRLEENEALIPVTDLSKQQVMSQSGRHAP